MKTQYACLHLDKAKGSDSAMSIHIERRNDDGTVYYPKSADPTRTHLNKELVKFSDDVGNRTEAINRRIKTAGLVRKVSDNQTRAIRVILGGSHDRMKELEAEGRLGEWCKASLDWAKDTWGADNVVSAVLHLDEKTPHIHLTLVPITVSADKRNKKGNVKVRLAANDIMARWKLRNYQDTYARAMERFGLHRGVNGSENKHKTTEEFFREQGINIKEEQAEVEELQTKKKNLEEDFKGLQKVVEQKSAELQTTTDAIKKVREEKMQIEEAVVKGKAENAKVQKENKQLQDTHSELQAKTEAMKKDVADWTGKGEKAKMIAKNEEVNLRNLQSKTKEAQQELDILIDDGEKAQEEAPHFSYAAFDPDPYIPTISTPPTLGKDKWVKEQNATIEKQCRLIAEKARKSLIDTITSQDDCINRISESLIAANKKNRLAEQRTEKETLIEKAVKAICDFFRNSALRPSAENAIHDAYVAFLKDFFGDSTLGRNLIKEANLRIENGVRKQTNDPKLLQACQDLLGKMWEKAVFLLREVLHKDEREEENRTQYRR